MPGCLSCKKQGNCHPNSQSQLRCFNGTCPSALLRAQRPAPYAFCSCRQYLPGPVIFWSQLGHSYGITTGSSSARSSFLAAQAAAAAAGPGSIMQYEAYVQDGDAGNLR